MAQVCDQVLASEQWLHRLVHTDASGVLLLADSVLVCSPSLFSGLQWCMAALVGLGQVKGLVLGSGQVWG